MDIVNKIEIKHFRSFDGGKDQTKVKIDCLKDLNIFSGANDSGKSNVLRALNLFFNNEISPGVRFDKTRDFSKIVSNRFDSIIEDRKEEERIRVEKLKEENILEKPKDLRRSDEVVSIKLFFNNKNNQRGLPKKFWVAKSYSQKNNFEGEYIYQTNLKGNAQVTLFIKSFRFEYIPAIKDSMFFNYLFEKLQTYLFEKEDKKQVNKFAKSSSQFSKMLKTETEELFKKFKRSSNVDASFHIPSTLVDFFRTLSVRTENDISLFDRGDGVQARFIPEILDEISKNSNKNILWGFEEPENSYEAKNIRKIRDEFLSKYSRKKQIFVTTHTKEFLSIKRKFTNKENKILTDKKLKSTAKKELALSKLSLNDSSSAVSIYRVWKNETTNNSSLVTRFNESNSEWDKTCDDLGIIQESRIVESLQLKLTAQSKEIEKSALNKELQIKVTEELNTKILDCISELECTKLKIEEYEKPVLIVEDKYDSIYKIAFLKLNEIPFTDNSLDSVFTESCYFIIRRAEGARAVAGNLSMNNTDGYNDKKIIGLFDYDSEGAEKFYHLKGQNNWDNIIQGDSETGVFKKRNQHPCFYALLIPVPARHAGLISRVHDGVFESHVEIENLLRDEILTSNNLVETKTIMSTSYLKIKNDKKQNLQKLLTTLSKSDFNDFLPLFTKLKELFNI